MNRTNRQPALVLSMVSVTSLGIIAVACGDYPMASAIGGSSTTSASTTSASTTDTASTTAGTTESTSTTGDLPDNTAALPCAVLGDAGHECVSAHSTVRVLVEDYTGPLYQLDDGSTTLDIGSVDGYADGAAHAEFCSGSCTYSIIYDQSGYGNNLRTSPPGSAKATPGNPVNAKALPVDINGRSVYGMLFRPGQGYRAACTECLEPQPYPSGVPIGDDPQTQYMVTSQHDLIDGCCFDYGNAEVTSNNDGNGTMETVYFGFGVIWGTGSGDGPWVMADMENGLFPGWENGSFRNISTNTSLKHDFVTAVVVGDTADKNDGKGRFALYGGDATTAEIKEMYDGIRPEKPGYVPMQKQGSVILGIGGDNSDGDGGRFYEGVIALGAAEKSVVESLSGGIADAGYGK